MSQTTTKKGHRKNHKSFTEKHVFGDGPLVEGGKRGFSEGCERKKLELEEDFP